MTMIDDYTGEIPDKLDELGQAEDTSGGPESGWEGFVNQRVFRTLEWKQEWGNDPRWKNRLFHLTNDPLETRDLFDHPEYQV